MRTWDWPLFVRIALRDAVLDGLCLAALTTQAQNATWTGSAGTGFCNSIGNWAQPQSPIHPKSHINSYTTHAIYLRSFLR